MVVPLYVLLVAIRSCVFKGAVPGSPSYGEPFRRGVVAPYVAVILVFDCPFTFYRGGFHLSLVVEYDFVPFAGLFDQKNFLLAFSDMFFMRPASVIMIGVHGGPQLAHIGTTTHLEVLSSRDWCLLDCHLTSFICLSHEYPVAFQARSALGKAGCMCRGDWSLPCEHVFPLRVC